MDSGLIFYERLCSVIIKILTAGTHSSWSVSYTHLDVYKRQLFARARGETTRQLVVRHGLRNIALPAITLQFASFSELFGGIALAESVFSYPGLGSALTAAALNADAPLLIGIAMFSALFVFAGNLIANILYGIIDPRLKEGGYRA